MDEYIEREKLVQALTEWQTTLTETYGKNDEYVRCLDSVLLGIDNIPAADVRPVVKATWYWDKDGMDWNIGAWRCSSCKAMSPMWWNADRSSPWHKSGHRFCPKCGAMMEKS